jgi:type II secretory pathway component PulK
LPPGESRNIEKMKPRSIKLPCFLKKLNNNSGIILIVILWILVILSFLAVGLGRRTGMELSLTKHAIGKVKSKYIAVAGIVYAMNEMSKKSTDEETNLKDTRFQCGFRLDKGQTPEDLFKDIKATGGTFSVFPSAKGVEKKIYYGFSDEQGRINLNALNFDNYSILKYLIVGLGYDEETAEGIACATLDWRDENDEVFHGPYGAEDDYYLSLENSYSCKNAPFDSIHELLLVKGMTKEIFAKIKNFVTIYPKTGRLLININTASEGVLRAFARSFSGAKTNAAIEDADSLAEKILAYRRGEDGVEATEDDRQVIYEDLALNRKERVITLLMSQNQTNVSQFLRVRVRGAEEAFSTFTDIEAVVDKNNLRIVYWHRN